MTLFPEHTIDGPPARSEAPPTRRSAGFAWALSLVAPGAGQLYCGALTRGVATLLIFSGALFVLVFSSDFRPFGIRLAMMLYAFAGLDAYLTAVELNVGLESDAPDNPRVAGILNLTTNGFGYIYLGWKIGFGIVMLLAAFWRLMGSILPLIGEAVAVALAVHAYNGARHERAEVYSMRPESLEGASHIPPMLPWAVSWVVLGGYFLLVALVQVVLLRRFFSR